MSKNTNKLSCTCMLRHTYRITNLEDKDCAIESTEELDMLMIEEELRDIEFNREDVNTDRRNNENYVKFGHVREAFSVH